MTLYPDWRAKILDSIARLVAAAREFTSQTRIMRGCLVITTE